jgi:F-type H+-transporting ATPase subunit epsilon
MPVHFELVSPERLLMSVDAEMVTLPGGDGDFGVLPGHAPLISTLRPGVIEVQVGGRTDDVFVRGGFAEVANDRLTVLAEAAIPLGDVDRQDIERQIRQAQEEMAAARDAETRGTAERALGHLSALMDALERPRG